MSKMSSSGESKDWKKKYRQGLFPKTSIKVAPTWFEKREAAAHGVSAVPRNETNWSISILKKERDLKLRPKSAPIGNIPLTPISKEKKPKSRAKSTDTVPKDEEKLSHHSSIPDKIECNICHKAHSTWAHRRWQKEQEKEEHNRLLKLTLSSPLNKIDGGKKKKSLFKKKRTKKKRKKRTKKRRKKRTKKKGKYNKCVKFFTKRHRVTKKKALKLCKVMFG